MTMNCSYCGGSFVDRVDAGLPVMICLDCGFPWDPGEVSEADIARHHWSWGKEDYPDMNRPDLEGYCQGWTFAWGLADGRSGAIAAFPQDPDYMGGYASGRNDV